MLRNALVFFVLVCMLCPVRAQRCGVTDTIDISQFGETSLTIPIAGYLNDNLAATNQSLCKVSIYFQHSYVYGLTLSLVSPAGDTAQLIGPQTDQTRPPTTLARWFIDFQRCSEPASPDPGAPLRWDNTDVYNWPAFGTFQGSYYPANQCFNNFNEGSLNGNWQLIVRNDRGGQQGTITFFQLEFCDDRHLEGPCCFADAGELVDLTPFTACAEPDDLPVALTPRYRQPRPDAADYGYTFAIARNDTLLALEGQPNLAGLPAGSYEVCGLSYQRDELSLIPTDGSTTLTDLRRDLTGSDPSLCADLTAACQSIVLVPPPPTTFLDRIICRGGFTTVGAASFNAAGVYTEVLPGAFGCDSLVTLSLSVADTLYAAVDTTVCAGGTYLLGNRILNQTGSYVDTLSSFFGCDSIIAVTLIVSDPIETTVTTAVCAGEPFMIGDEAFSESGVYVRSIPAANGCDSTVTLDLIALAPSIAYAPFRAQLDCLADSVRLDAGRSVLSYATDVGWFDLSGVRLSSELVFTVTEPGAYIFRLLAETRGVSCVVSDTLIITDERQRLRARLLPVLPNEGALPPVPCTDANGPCNIVTCRNPVVGIQAEVNPNRPGDIYRWSGAGGTEIVGSADSSLLFVARAGRYNLSVTSPATGCRLDTFIIISQDKAVPDLDVTGNDLITCVVPSITLSVNAGQISQPELEYGWSSPDCVLGNPVNQQIITSCPGRYSVSVLDRNNGCRADTTFLVEADTTPVQLNLAPAAAPITCFDPARILSGGNFTAGNEVAYEWTRVGTAAAIGNQQRLTVTLGGTYQLRITDLTNGCFDLGRIVVPADNEPPVADAGPDSVTLNCYVNTQLLGGPNTTTGSDLSHVWMEISNGPRLVGSDRFLEVNPPAGTYVLTALDEGNGCSDADTVSVITDLEPPAIQFAENLDFDCFNDTITLANEGINLTPSEVGLWTGPCIAGSADRDSVAVVCPGTYVYNLFNLENGCGATDFVEVLRAPAPLAEAGPSDTIDCYRPAITLSAAGSSEGPLFAYQWNDENNNLISMDAGVDISEGGSYRLRVLQLETGCRSVDTVTIVEDKMPPGLMVMSDGFPCDGQQAPIVAAATGAREFSFLWNGPDIISGGSSASVSVAAPGSYGVVATRLDNGCVAERNYELLQLPCPPFPELADTTLTCRDETVVLRPGFRDGCRSCNFSWRRNGVVLPAARDSFLQVARTGVYLLTATNEFGLTNTTQAIVTDSRTVLSAAAGPDQIINCRDRTAFLGSVDTADAQLYDFDWRRPSGQMIPGGASGRLPVTEGGAYLLTLTDRFSGCTAFDTVLVAVDTLAPRAVAGPERTLTCDAKRRVLDGTASSFGRRLRYAWRSEISDACLSGAETLNPIARCDGNYTLTVLDTVNGCSAISSTKVFRDDDLPAIFPLNDTTLTCAVRSISLRGGEIGPAAITYNWESISGSEATPVNETAPGVIEVVQGGTYRFNLLNTRSGCSNNFTVAVVADQAVPIVEAGRADTFSCGIDSMVLAATLLANGDPNLRYNWSSRTGFSISLASTLSPVIFQPDTYLVEALNLRNQCRGVDSIIIPRDVEMPLVNAGPDGVITCALPQVQLNGGYTSISGEGIIHWILLGQPSISPPAILAPTANQPGSYQLNVTDPRNNCAGADVVTIRADTLPPPANISARDGPAVTCINPVLTFIANPLVDDGYQYAWSRNGSGLGADRRQVLRSGGDLSLSVFNPANGCAATSAVEVGEDLEAPSSSVRNPEPLTCLRDSSTLAVLDPDFSRAYSWLDARDSLLATGRSFAVREAGGYALVTRLIRNGCSDTIPTFVPEDKAPPRIGFLDAAPLDCDRVATIVSASGSDRGERYQAVWTYPEGSATPRNDPYQLLAREPGEYGLILIDLVTGCRADSATFVARIGIPIDSIEVEVMNPSCRENSTGELLVTGVSGGRGPYRYRLNGGILSDRQFYGELPPGDYVIEATGADGCTTREAVSVGQADVSTLELRSDTLIGLGDSVRLNFSTTFPEATLTWSSGGMVIPGRGREAITVAPLTATRYQLIAESPDGCRLTDDVFIEVEDVLDVFIPNAFSPNGDGTNDLLRPFVGAQVDEILRFTLYNRWGGRLYDSREDPAITTPEWGWDGRVNGRPISAQQLVWKIELRLVDGREVIRRGGVVLLR